jgi:hypothetical protein
VRCAISARRPEQMRSKIVPTAVLVGSARGKVPLLGVADSVKASDRRGEAG